MYDADLPSKAAPGRMYGRAELGYENDSGISRLSRLYQHAPLRVLFPDPEAGEPPLAALVTTSGGLTGGDRLVLSAGCGAQARALIMNSAAEKIYRSDGADVMVDMHLSAQTGSWLEYLPQETILFEASRLRRRCRVDCFGDGAVLAGEMLVFGRKAKGESLTSGLVRDSWEIRRDNRLVWADSLHMDNDLSRPLTSVSGFAGAKACASIILAAADAERHLDSVRDAAAQGGGRIGAGMVGGVLIVRFLDEDAARMREDFARIWGCLRLAAAGLPARLPRLWHV